MIETGKQLAEAAMNLAKNHKTIYALGCFGWPMNKTNQARAIDAYAYNGKEARADQIRNADNDTFAFDCVGMIKALLWGWNGDTQRPYGGAIYGASGVPDKNANQMIALCRDVSDNFANIQIGEAVWKKGHIGIYVGDGLAVECTPKWSDGVQITAVHNLGKKSAYNGRNWTSHGKLPWIGYEEGYDLHLNTLRKGCKGKAVIAIQQLLKANGYACGDSGADGSFGGATATAVRSFQAARGLKVDGVVGAETMAVLLGVEHHE